MATKTADEVRAENVRVMGPDLGELYTVLYEELVRVCWLWSQYVMLFADKPSRIDILNRSAPFFFWNVQVKFHEDALLGIARLAGPERTLGKDNLAPERLPALLTDAKLKAEVQSLLKKVKSSSRFAVGWRNRHIAHRDLDLALRNKQVKPLPKSSKVQVDEALDAMAAVLNAVQRHYFPGSSTFYRGSPTSPGDAEELLHVLRDGLRREELRQRRIEKAGEYDPADWNDDLPPI